MTSLAAAAPAAGPLPANGIVAGAAAQDVHRHAQRLARLTGILFLVTYATSIPPFVLYYVPAVSDPAFVLGGGYDRGIAIGAFLELLLIAANVGSALALYPVLRRRHPVLSLGFVAARIVESVFIAIGIVALLALNTLRLQGAADEGALVVVGQALVAVHDWTFNLGPGVVVGLGNGLILGWMMWRTRLVPRALSVLGLIGGPGILIFGTAMVFGLIESGTAVQVVLTIPEFFWELSLGLWLTIFGFSRSGLADLEGSS